MVEAIIPLSGTDSTVLNPIVKSVVEDIKYNLDISRNVDFEYDEDNLLPIGNNEVGRTIRDNAPPIEGIYLEIEEIVNDSSNIKLSNLRGNRAPIIEDKEIGLNVKALYMEHDLNLTFKYTHKSKSSVNRVMNKLKVLPALGKLNNYHNLSYSYMVPDYIMRILMNINRIKSSVDGEKTLEEYMTEVFDNRLSLEYPEDFNVIESSIDIKEVNKNVLGSITSDLSSIQREYDKEKSIYSVSFTYKLSYLKPVSLKYCYPIMVYNQHLDDSFFEFIENKEELVVPMDGMTEYFQDLDRRDLKIELNSYYPTIPSYDNFVLPKPELDTARLFTVLISIDSDNKRELFNLEDISDQIDFKDEIIDMITDSEYLYMNKIHQSPLYIELYKDGKKDIENEILIDSNLNITTRDDMDIKSTYRVVFNIVTNMTRLTFKTKKRLGKYMAVNGTAYALANIFKDVLSISHEYDLHKKDINVSNIDVFFEMKGRFYEYYINRMQTTILTKMMKDVKCQ